MIQLPKRSVTRFFIPLIDVLILLFCIFLLLPFVSNENEADTSTAELSDDPAVLKKQLRDALDAMKIRDEELRRLYEERARVAERTVVKVLEIDGDSGELFYFNTEGPRPERVKINSEAQTLELIARTKQTADGKPVYFLVLYPRQRSRFPTEPQVRSYEDWLKTVPNKFDNPFAAR